MPPHNNYMIIWPILGSSQFVHESFSLLIWYFPQWGPNDMMKSLVFFTPIILPQLKYFSVQFDDILDNGHALALCHFSSVCLAQILVYNLCIPHQKRKLLGKLTKFDVFGTDWSEHANNAKLLTIFQHFKQLPLSLLEVGHAILTLIIISICEDVIFTTSKHMCYGILDNFCKHTWLLWWVSSQ